MKFRDSTPSQRDRSVAARLQLTPYRCWFILCAALGSIACATVEEAKPMDSAAQGGTSTGGLSASGGIPGSGGSGTGGSRLLTGGSPASAGMSGGASGTPGSGGSMATSGGASGSNGTGGAGGGSALGGSAGAASGGAAAGGSSAAGSSAKGGAAFGGASGSGGASGGAGAPAKGGVGGISGNAGTGGASICPGFVFCDDFEDGNITATPAWISTPSAFSVVDDGANKVLKKVAMEAWAYGSSATWTDMTVQARVKVLDFGGTSSTNCGGLVARWQGSSTPNYLAALCANGSVGVYKDGELVDETNGTKAMSIVANTWYLVSLKVSGVPGNVTLTLSIDDTPALTIKDTDTSNPVANGYMALGSKKSLGISYDDVKVSVP
jgi:hypothetical protein